MILTANKYKHKCIISIFKHKYKIKCIILGDIKHIYMNDFKEVKSVKEVLSVDY